MPNTQSSPRHLAALITSLLIAASVLISGCGYQLRGQGGLAAALAQAHLDDQAHNQAFKNILARRIQLLGGSITQERSSASGSLQILKVELHENGIGIADTGRVNENQISLSVRYRLVPSGQKAQDQRTRQITQRRQYVYDPNQLLAMQSERERLENELRAAVADAILRQLRYAP